MHNVVCTIEAYAHTTLIMFLYFESKNFSYIKKMKKCFLHFGNAVDFQHFSHVFLQLSKLELFLHFKIV